MNESDRTTRFYRELWPHRGAVLRAAVVLTRQTSDAEDLAQDVMLKAFGALERLTPGTNAHAWLMTILRNAHIDRLRAMHGKAVSLDTLEIEPAAEDFGAAEDVAAWDDPERMLAELSDEQVIAAMKALPREICWTLLLVDVEGLDDLEAAQVLGVPGGTVKSRLHRGRRMLRETLLPVAKERRIGVERAEKRH